MRNVIVLILLLFISGATNAQKYAFTTYSSEEGLPQSQVTAICQDKDGYLWVATLGGLAKFNGGEFTTFSSSNGLLNNRVTTLAYFDNTLWIGNDGGISYMRNNVIKHVAFSGNDKSRGVSKIIEFKGKILVLSNGGGIWELKDGRLEKKLINYAEHRKIRDAYAVNGVLYLATRRGILMSHDGTSFAVNSELDTLSYSGITGNRDKIYFSTYFHGIFIKDIVSNKLTTITMDEINNGIYDHSIGGCYLDQRNTLWLNSDAGIVTISPEREFTYIDQAQGLPLDAISCLYEDSDQNIWIGSQGKGMFKFSGEAFSYYDQSTGFPTDLFLTGFQKGNGDFYYGTYQNGIVRKDNQGNITVVDASDHSIWASLQGIDRKDWFGTQVSLVSIDDNGIIRSFSEEDGLPGYKITALYRVAKNEMYVGGNFGVSHYIDGVFKHLMDDDAEEIGTVRDFEIVNGILYCVTNLGLFEYKNRKFELYGGVGEVVYNIELDAYGKLWIGTEEGLYRLKGNDRERVDLGNNPGSSYINLLNYRKGKLYVGTNNGLYVLSDLNNAKPKVRRFGVGEGIVDLETNLNSGFFDKQGRFWFGTASGLVCFDPGKVQLTNIRPRIRLKSILLNYESFNYEDYSNNLDEYGFPTDLSFPTSKNNLIFELDGISLSNHKGLSYQFWLEGLNDDWSPLSSNSSVTFTSLPAGSYILHMRSVDVDGNVSQEINVPFIIREAYYKTWWFITLCVLGVAAIVILIFRLRLRRLNQINTQEKLVYKSRLISLEQQSMNASMNRHFVFNSLNSIQYFINTQDRLSANKYLTNFANLIRKNLDSATADGNMVTLDEELERLELYLSLESMRFKDRFDYVINVKNIDTESIKIPAMIMQPFVENSIIHGILANTDKKGLIEIEVYVKDNYLILSIEDNGVGVNHSIKNKVELEGDHRSKGMEITSKRIELLQKVSDNDISLVGPYELVDDNGLINGTHVSLKISLKDLEN